MPPLCELIDDIDVMCFLADERAGIIILAVLIEASDLASIRQKRASCYLRCYLEQENGNFESLNPLILLARREGFEPPTPRFVVL